jgi:hypothetical protein
MTREQVSLFITKPLSLPEFEPGTSGFVDWTSGPARRRKQNLLKSFIKFITRNIQMLYHVLHREMFCKD